MSGGRLPAGDQHLNDEGDPLGIGKLRGRDPLGQRRRRRIQHLAGHLRQMDARRLEFISMTRRFEGPDPRKVLCLGDEHLKVAQTEHLLKHPPGVSMGCVPQVVTRGELAHDPRAIVRTVSPSSRIDPLVKGASTGLLSSRCRSSSANDEILWAISHAGPETISPKLRYSIEQARQGAFPSVEISSRLHTMRSPHGARRTGPGHP